MNRSLTGHKSTFSTVILSFYYIILYNQQISNSMASANYSYKEKTTFQPKNKKIWFYRTKPIINTIKPDLTLSTMVKILKQIPKDNK